MKLILITITGALLAGCTPETQSQLAKGCDAARTAYSAYTIAAEGELVPANLQGKVNAAWKGVRIVCENPPTDNRQAVLTVTAATVVFINAWKAVN